MKKLLLIITLALNTQLSFSQSTNRWLDIGTDWHYSVWYFNFNYPTGFNHYYYAQDTTINGRIFQQVKMEQQMRTTDNNGNHILGDTVIFPSKHFYTSNDTVYILNPNNSLQFVWFNNPVVGDIWDFGLQYDLIAGNNKHAYSQVDSIKFVSINGENLKEIYSHSSKDSIGTPIQFGDTALLIVHINRINTKFGPIYGFNGINTYETAQITDGFSSDNLLCFESSTFSFYQVGNTDCNNGILTNNAAELNDDNNVLLFPNPTNDKLHFTALKANCQITIFNQLGQLQENKIQLNSSTIDVSNLVSGLYFYSITDAQKNSISKGKFIKE